MKRLPPCPLVWLAAAATVAAAEPHVLPDITVLAERRGAAPDDARGATLARWDEADLMAAAPRTLDELLAAEPSFSLYRRQTSLFGNPTSAGVSLRNTGATAASRTLVLKDGIPQNDPFGGWVYWARHDPATLGSARIVPAARAAVWGNASPAGVVQLTSPDPFQERHVLRAGGGSHGTWSAAASHTLVGADDTVSASLSAFSLHSDGFHALPSWQRGPIDRRLETDAYGADFRLAWRAPSGLTVEPAVSWYEEDRTNGTPYTGNSTEALDLSLRVTGSSSADLTWQALGYLQQRRFSSTFSSVNPARTAETPSLDQFHVPGEGSGGAFTLQWSPDGAWSFTTGADFRKTTGETNEDAGYSGGSYLRRRQAGGSQQLAGVFVAGAWAPESSDTRVDASFRLDGWETADGRRIEKSLTTGATLRQDVQQDRSGTEPSLALALTHEATDGLTFGLSAGSSFRLPTLNELHRPFRVRNDLTEANPALDPERFYSVELTAEWDLASCLTADAAVFHHWIHDAIANVPVTDPARIAAIFGSLPTGGTGAQRQNVAEARVAGVQAGLEWTPRDTVTVRFDGLWSDTRFSDSPAQPLLEDKPFPQAPDLRLMASAEWQVTERIGLSAGWEYGASQYDDALARRRIPSYTSVRLGAAWQATEALSFHARVDNLLDEEIATGLSGDGLRTIAGPRSAWLGAEWRF